MDDTSQTSRRSRPLPPRPESSTSSQTRMTPSSSNNSSSVNLPRNHSLSSSRGASGTSLLQERLRERKGESILARRRSIDIGDKTLPSSPLKSKEERRPSSSGAGKGMGVKQMEEVSYPPLRALAHVLTTQPACLYVDEAEFQPQARTTSSARTSRSPRSTTRGCRETTRGTSGVARSQ